MAMSERWTTAGPIRTAVPMETIEQEKTRATSYVGEPGPLGLLGFATGTFTISAVLAGWFPATTVLFASAVVFIFGGLGQFIAGMWAYRKGDTFSATAFGSFGAFNTAYALYLWMHQSGLIVGPGSGLGVIGIMLACFSFIAAALMVAAMWRNMALVAVLLFLALTYGLVGAGNIAGGAPNLISEGGWAGLISSTIAFYTAAAMLINSASERELLPLGHRMMSDDPSHLNMGRRGEVRNVAETP